MDAGAKTRRSVRRDAFDGLCAIFAAVAVLLVAAWVIADLLAKS
jgi:hypothetical protein